MTLPREVRLWLRNMFDIPQSNVVEVRDNTVLTDGVTNDDLKAITLEKLQKFTKKDGKFSELFEILIQEVQLQMAVINGSVIPKELKAKFCDLCSSKGVRHLKTCPKNTL